MFKENQLRKFIEEYPNLPIIPLIGKEYQDNYNEQEEQSLGAIQSVFISSYCSYKMYGTNYQILKRDEGLLENYFYDKSPYNDEKKTAHYVQEKLKKIKWRKAIFVYLKSF